LAKKYNAPILLTTPDKLDPAAEAEINRLKVKNIIIVGGSGVVSADIENYLKSKGINCTRIAGDDRYRTSIEVAKSIGSFNMVALATGEDFPDALSIAPYAASAQIPIILTEKNEIPHDVKDYLKGKNINAAYVVGGQGVISDEAVKDIPNARRLSGADRYATNLAVINEFKDAFRYGSVYLATGENFPDALSGSAVASLTNSPIFLVDNTNILPVREYIRARNNIVNSINIIGGDGVVYNSSVLDIIKN
jgi:putative cell wall-binding protein